ADGNVTAYFYNRDDKLLEKISRPPRRQGDDRQYIDPPKSFEKNKTVEVYYPLTTFLEDSDWATVLVAFGSGREYSVETMPKRSLEALDFAEKEFVFPGWVPDANRSMEDENSNVEPEIRRLKVEDKYPYSLSFNGDYRRDMPCVMGEVRVTGDITPGEGVVRLHGFDANGIKKATRQRPSSFQIEGSSSYVGRPQIADDNWHPVAFALDDYFSDRYPTYVMVFQFQGKTTAEAVSSTGATITDLDFPEKKDLKPADE
ncbi:MAG: hypothetical protein P1V20_32505, partial [Verrucomicrobiales bacterium]|nr:hypothetical protein [Verrucomicrobiales bacterium]